MTEPPATNAAPERRSATAPASTTSRSRTTPPTCGRAGPAPGVPRVAAAHRGVEGRGQGRLPDDRRALRFGQQLVFAHDGRPFVSYESRAWLLGPDGEVLRPAARETGFWRPQARRRAGGAGSPTPPGSPRSSTGCARTLTSWEIETDAVVRTGVGEGRGWLRTGSTASSRGSDLAYVERAADDGSTPAAAPLRAPASDRRLARRIGRSIRRMGHPPRRVGRLHHGESGDPPRRVRVSPTVSRAFPHGESGDPPR